MFCCAAAAWSAPARAGEGGSPEEWRDGAYRRRFMIRAEPAPAGDGIGLAPPPAAARLTLSKDDFGEAGPLPGAALLLDGEGSILPLAVRRIEGTDQFDVLFPAGRSGGRFALYLDPVLGSERRRSPEYTSVPSAARMRGLTPRAGYPSGEKDIAATLEAVAKIARESEQIGVRELRSLWLPANPFGSPERFLGCVEGFIRAPEEGIYRFRAAAGGAFFLLINGKTVIGCEGPPPAKGVAEASGSVSLPAGVHRLAAYYWETVPGSGFRVSWAPPSSADLMPLGGRALAEYLPAEVAALDETAGPGPGGDGGVRRRPFVDVELLLSLNTRRRGSYAVAFARATGMPPGRTSLSLNGARVSDGPVALLFLPGGRISTIAASAADGGTAPAARQLRIPPLFPDSIPLEGEVLLKGAPVFLYEDETARIHMEVRAGEGGFTGLALSYVAPPCGDAPEWRGTIPLVPDEEGVARARLDIGPAEMSHRRVLTISLERCGVPGDEIRLAMLHSRGMWPEISAARDGLRLPAAGGREPAPWLEGAGDALVLVTIPREDEAGYRKMAVLGRIRAVLRSRGTRVLFIGDPLAPPASGCAGMNGRPPAPLAPADSVAPPGRAPSGSGPAAGSLPLPTGSPPPPAPAAARGGSPRARTGAGIEAKLKEHVGADRFESAAAYPEPGRFFVMEMLAVCEREVARLESEGKKVSAAVVSVGLGDARAQTPPHEFERALDALVDRLRLRGVEDILLVGPPPEPGREKNSTRYGERVLDIARMHHLDAVDLHGLFLKYGDIRELYRDERGSGSDPVMLPYPNSKGLDAAWAAVLERL
ncbi:MAG: hypothetical protein N3A38_03700 [Planctomycetota bacterium]|nr:hypothetical protein [Planctomycetota bacterium]